MVTRSSDGQLSTGNRVISTVVPVVEPRLVTPFSAGDQSVWVDATGFFATACDELKIGELIHGENFSLFEAMAALEIMDPKMDSGMTMTGYTSVEEVIEKGAAPLDLTEPQIIDVMDHLLSCEMLKWQEEDLVTFGYGLPLEGEADSKCLATLNAVEEQQARQLRGCKGQNAAKEKVAEEVEPLQDAPDLEESFIDALLSRLRIDKHSVSAQIVTD